MDNNQGALVYSTPPYKKGKRFLAAIILITSILVPIGFFANYYRVVWVEQTQPLEIDFLLVMIAIFSLFFIIRLPLADRVLFPKLRIYENGISRFATPIFTDREGEFIPYSNMKNFSISKQINPGLTCRVNLKVPPGEFIIWHSYDRKHILPIIEALKNNNISEID